MAQDKKRKPRGGGSGEVVAFPFSLEDADRHMDNSREAATARALRSLLFGFNKRTTQPLGVDITRSRTRQVVEALDAWAFGLKCGESPEKVAASMERVIDEARR